MKFDYIEEANVTMSDAYYSDRVSHQAFLTHVREAVDALKKLDVIKKALFYGRHAGEGMYLPHEHDIFVHRLHDDGPQAVRILHGIIGLATEAGELLEALAKSVEGETLDRVNLVEECGDVQWYIAALLRVLHVEFDDVHRINIAKLRKRFPNKFTEYEANNRNIEAERKVLEAKPQGKPVVDIKDWKILKNRLVGTALNHPAFDGETDVMSGVMLAYDMDARIVETRNTTYRLVGDELKV